MMRELRHLLNYFGYLRKAKTAHGIHSPFVYQFVTEVLNDKTAYPEYQLVNRARDKFLQSSKVLEVTDFGAGAGIHRFRTRFRRMREIAKNSAIPHKFGELLFRMIRFYKPEFALELGTSFGLSTLYMAMANKETKLITIEGCAVTAEVAEKSFRSHNLDNTELHIGEFTTTLDSVTEKLPRLDFAFIDGNHRIEPTLHYFSACLKKSHNDTILVFDDIYWSKGMEQAWKQIKSHPQVTVSIDLFRIGIVFLRKELSKEDFVLRQGI
jgi:predicted O-methyltransferase YrrM